MFARLIIVSHNVTKHIRKSISWYLKQEYLKNMSRKKGSLDTKHYLKHISWPESAFGEKKRGILQAASEKMVWYEIDLLAEA